MNDLLEMNDDELTELLIEDPLYSNKGNLRILIRDLLMEVRHERKLSDYYKEDNEELKKKMDEIRDNFNGIFDREDY